MSTFTVKIPEGNTQIRWKTVRIIYRKKEDTQSYKNNPPYDSTFFDPFYDRSVNLTEAYGSTFISRP